MLSVQHNILAPDLTAAQFAARSYSFTVPDSSDKFHAPATLPASAPPVPGIYNLTDAERYAALAKLYRVWAVRTGDGYHQQWANCFEAMASIPASSV